MKKQQLEELQDDESLASYLPIKNHIKRIEELIDNLQKDLIEDATDIDKVRNDQREMNDKHNKDKLQLHNLLMDHCQKIVGDMREMNNQSKVETYNLKQQLSALNQDKIRLQQNVIVLENRVNETDKDIGFKRRAKALQSSNRRK